MTSTDRHRSCSGCRWRRSRSFPTVRRVHDLFGAGGAELSVHDAREYGFDSAAPVRFGDLREASTRVGHVLLGVQGLVERRMC